MEVIVVALAVLTGFLLLAILGAMREVTLLRGEVEAFAQLIKSPPAPSFVRTQAPDALKRVLRARVPAAGVDGAQLVAFVSPYCQSCERLAKEVEAAAHAGSVADDRLLFVVWARTEAEAIEMSAKLPGRTVLDVDGSLATACEIRATPTLFLVSDRDFTVVDYTLEGDAQWVLNHLTPTAAPVLATAP